LKTGIKLFTCINQGIARNLEDIEKNSFAPVEFISVFISMPSQALSKCKATCQFQGIL
jgi:hypothetical protein